MIKIKDLIVSLNDNELRSLRLDLNKADTFKQVIEAIQEAVTTLNVEFEFEEKELIIETKENISTYELHNRHSLVNGTHYDKYIDDSIEPFNNDVMHIFKIINDVGVSLPINDHTNPISIKIIRHDAIQLPFSKDDEQLFILYASYIFLNDYNSLDEVGDDIINISEYYTRVLKDKICSILFSNIPSMDGTNQNSLFERKYNQGVRNLKLKNFQNESKLLIQNDFTKGHWV